MWTFALQKMTLANKFSRKTLLYDLIYGFRLVSFPSSKTLYLLTAFSLIPFYCLFVRNRPTYTLTLSQPHAMNTNYFNDESNHVKTGKKHRNLKVVRFAASWCSAFAHIRSFKCLVECITDSLVCKLNIIIIRLWYNIIEGVIIHKLDKFCARVKTIKSINSLQESENAKRTHTESHRWFHILMCLQGEKRFKLSVNWTLYSVHARLFVAVRVCHLYFLSIYDATQHLHGR